MRREDNRALPSFLHDRYLGLRSQESACQIDRNDIVPITETHIGDRPHLSHDTGIVECAVQPTELFHGEIDESIGVIFILYIAGKEYGPAIAMIDLSSKGFQLGRSARAKDYIGLPLRLRTAKPPLRQSHCLPQL